MTDKQIIIDGVDVSGCSCHYNGWSQLYRDIRDMCDKGYDLECKPKENGCYHYTKCLEEQLKAKEQECEELKEKLIKWLGKEGLRQSEKEFYEQQLDQLKAENEELKKKCNIYTCGICGNKEDCNKLYKTLTEIKEIAEGVKVYDPLAKQILQKISECEVEND